MAADNADFPSLGQQLRDARLQQKIKIPDIATQLCIKPDYLKAIEADDFSQLPDGVYRRAFVRSYAQHLGLDAKKLPSATVPPLKKAVLSRSLRVFDHSGSDAVTSMPSRLTLLFSVLMLIGAAAMWFRVGRSDDAQVLAIPSAPQAVQDVAADLTDMVQAVALLGRDSVRPPVDTLQPQGLLDDVAAAPAAVPVAPTATLVIRATAETFVEVRDSTGAVVFEKVMQPGEVYPFPEQSGFTLLTGNAGGLVFIVEGESLGAFGATDAVRRLENVSVESVRAAYAAAAPATSPDTTEGISNE